MGWGVDVAASPLPSRENEWQSGQGKATKCDKSRGRKIPAWRIKLQPLSDFFDDQKLRRHSIIHLLAHKIKQFHQLRKYKYTYILIIHQDEV